MSAAARQLHLGPRRYEVAAQDDTGLSSLGVEIHPRHHKDRFTPPVDSDNPVDDARVPKLQNPLLDGLIDGNIVSGPLYVLNE